MSITEIIIAIILAANIIAAVALYGKRLYKDGYYAGYQKCLDDALPTVDQAASFAAQMTPVPRACAPTVSLEPRKL